MTTHATMTAAGTELDGDLVVPVGAAGMVLFAHGTGSSRHSPRNMHIASALNAGGFATLLADLLTHDEEVSDARARDLRFDVGMLAERLVGLIDWVRDQPDLRDLPIGLFGASTGAAAALVAAATRPDEVRAVVSRGGRPDLAGPALMQVLAPTLLIVGGDDVPVVDLNEQARHAIAVTCEMRIVPGATHLFEEPGKLDVVAEEAWAWFGSHLR